MIPSVSIVIPTFGRERVLLDTVRSLLALPSAAAEILVVDQSLRHEPETASCLAEWHAAGRIRHLRRETPGVIGAMNHGLAEARCEIVLFLDDDIVPDPRLVEAHAAAHAAHPEAWAVAGQVLQPGEEPADLGAPEPRSGLRADLRFPFRGSRPGPVRNVMAGNLSVRREHALALGGFDPAFLPPVSYRFESDFARRIGAAGGTIWFCPEASIRHLRAPSGGTRTLGSHLTSASPLHGVGDCLFALRHARGWERWAYLLIRPLREVRTRFHLRHPWWIPVKLTGELRALMMALELHRKTKHGTGR
jgi:GT2 family glycosyltransferase